jgi:hypothetical protein
MLSEEPASVLNIFHKTKIGLLASTDGQMRGKEFDVFCKVSYGR